MNKEYFAFISYQREDEEWAKWLAHELEHYHLPLSLNGREDLPQDLRPIFRDVDELSAGNLPQQIHQALENAKHLIVICSPRSAKSPWVNKEIEEFVSMGKTDKIFPFIIEGLAMCKDSEDPLECFPPSLRNLPKDDERLGANVNENGHGSNILRTCDDCPIKEDHLKDDKKGDINEKGRDAAVVKIIAGMLGLSFDTLWQRYEREKAEEERKIKEQRDNLLKVQSRFWASKVHELIGMGDHKTARLLALAALPQNMQTPQRPYVAEAEEALRYTIDSMNPVEKVQSILRNDVPRVEIIQPAFLSPNGKTIISTYSTAIDYTNELPSDYSKESIIRIWGCRSGELMKKLNTKTTHSYATFSPNGKYIVSAGWDSIVYIWDRKRYRIIKTFKGGEDIPIIFIVFSKDSSHVVALSYVDILQIWEIETGNYHKINLNDEEMSDLGNVYPDIWDVIYRERGENVFQGNKTCYYLWDSINRIANTPNGQITISSDFAFRAVARNDVIVIYKNDGSIFKTIKGHNGRIRFVSFSPTGSKLVSTSDDGTIKIWDVDSGICVKTINESSYSAIFTPDGEKIVTISSETGSIQIRNFAPLQQLIDEFSKYRYGQLTSEERKKYYFD